MTDENSDRGLLLPCPLCGEPNASICLNLSDGQTFTCHECEGEFVVADVQRFITRWSAVLAWVGALPSLPE